MKKKRTEAVAILAALLMVGTATSAAAVMGYQLLNPGSNQTLTSSISSGSCYAETYSSEATDMAYTAEVLSSCVEVRVQAYYVASNQQWAGWSALIKSKSQAVFTTSGSLQYSKHWAGTP